MIDSDNFLFPRLSSTPFHHFIVREKNKNILLPCNEIENSRVDRFNPSLSPFSPVLSASAPLSASRGTSSLFSFKIRVYEY